jgi:hypothetical protein
MKPRSATTSTTPRHAHVVHINTAKRHSALALPCTFFAYDLAPPLGDSRKKGVNRRRDLISDHPNRATAAEAPLAEA